MAKKKLKVTIFHCSFIYTGGGERIVFGQIAGLKKRGYQVECFTSIIDEQTCYPDIINKYPIYSLLPQLPKWVPLRWAGLLLLTSLLAPFFSWRFRDTDVFIGANQPGTWLAFVIAKILAKPYLVYTCHPNKMVYPRSLTRRQIWRNQKDFYWLSLFFEPFRPVLKYLDKLSFTSSRFPVLVNGDFIGREFEAIYKTKWRYCPSGPHLRIKNNRVLKTNNLKGKLKLKEGLIKKPYLLYVGRHEVWKRIDWLIKAFAKINQEMPEANLVIRGPFSENTQALKKLTGKLKLEGKVIFSAGGRDQEELKKLYANAGLFVFPSPKEDFGIVMIEAMSFGLPVVAWNFGGPTDIVLDGRTGFLAKAYDLNDFSRKSLKILKDRRLRHKFGRAALKRVKNQFSWDKHLDILEKELKKGTDESKRL